MPIKFTKNGVESSFSGSEKFFKKGWKKIKHATKEPFFSLFLQKKTFKFLDTIFFKLFLKGVQNLKKIQIN